MLTMWPRGSRCGSEYTPISERLAATKPVSSASSRAAACSVVSPYSTYPPGSAYWPRNGGCCRRISSSRPPGSNTTQSTASDGCLAFMKIHRDGEPDNEPCAPSSLAKHVATKRLPNHLSRSGQPERQGAAYNYSR